MDIAQLPHLPEKTSESSETSDSESDSKDNSGNTHVVCLHTHKGSYYVSHSWVSSCFYFLKIVAL